MLKVYTANTLFQLQLIRNQLEFAGIETHVRNEFASGAMGDLAALDCLPELWLVDTSNLKKANAIVALFSPDEGPEKAEVNCEFCGNPCPGNFQRCWHCQSPLSNNVE